MPEGAPRHVGTDVEGGAKELEDALGRIPRQREFLGQGGPGSAREARAGASAEPGAAELASRVCGGELPLRDAVDELKRAAIRRALEATGGSWHAAAQRLGMDRGNLHHMARRLGVRAGPR